MKPKNPDDTSAPTETKKNSRVLNLRGKPLKPVTAEDWEKIKAYARDPNNKRRYPEIRLDYVVTTCY